MGLRNLVLVFFLFAIVPATYGQWVMEINYGGWTYSCSYYVEHTLRASFGGQTSTNENNLGGGKFKVYSTDGIFSGDISIYGHFLCLCIDSGGRTVEGCGTTSSGSTGILSVNHQPSDGCASGSKQFISVFNDAIVQVSYTIYKILDTPVVTVPNACGDNTYSISTTTIANNYLWEVSDKPSSNWKVIPGKSSQTIIVSAADLNPPNSNFSSAVRYVRVTDNSSNGCALTVSNVSSAFNAVPPPPRPAIEAWNDGPKCASTPAPTIKLSATHIDGATYTWTGPYNFSQDTILSYTDILGVAGTHTYHVTLLINGCSKSASTDVTINSNPTPSNAGPDQNICALSTTLAGNPPLTGEGTGTWTQVSGPPSTTTSFSSSTSGGSGASVTVPGTYLYRWTITTPCGSSTDEVQVVYNTTPTLTPPSNQTVCSGSNTTFTVGSPVAGQTYQWQVKIGAGAFTNIANAAPYSNATTSTLTITGATAALNTNQYQCVVAKPGCPSATSSAGALTVTSPPTLTAPTNQTVCSGSNTTFTVGSPVAGQTYQWQVRIGGGSPTNLANTLPYSNVTTSTLTITGATAALNTNQYQCVVAKPGCPSATSSAGALTVTSPPTLTAPTNQTVCSGSNTSFTVGSPVAGQTYQWQVRIGGGAPTNLANTLPYSNVTTSTLTITGATAALNTNQYQCVVAKPGCPSATSSAGALTVTSPPTLTAPTNQTVCSGSNTTFTVGSPVAGQTYQWQVRIGGGAPTNLANTLPYSNVTTSTLTITGATAALNTNQYQCVVAKPGCPSATSSAGALTVISPPTLTAPTNQTVCSGSNTTFTVGSPVAGQTYQWQVRIGGGSPTNLANTLPYSNVTTSTLTITGTTAALNTNQYQCVVAKPGCPSATSSAGALTVTSPPTLTAPTNQTVCSGSNTTFTVGSPVAGQTYQWQVRIGGGAPTNLANTLPYSNVTTSTLTITGATTALNTNQYQCVVAKPGCPSATSSAGALTVNSSSSSSFTYGGSPYCPWYPGLGLAPAPVPTFINGGLAGNFSSTPGLVFVSARTGEVNLKLSTPGTYTVTNTIFSSCSSSSTASLVIRPQIEFTVNEFVDGIRRNFFIGSVAANVNWVKTNYDYNWWYIEPKDGDITSITNEAPDKWLTIGQSYLPGFLTGGVTSASLVVDVKSETTGCKTRKVFGKPAPEGTF